MCVCCGRSQYWVLSCQHASYIEIARIIVYTSCLLSESSSDALMQCILALSIKFNDFGVSPPERYVSPKKKDSISRGRPFFLEKATNIFSIFVVVFIRKPSKFSCSSDTTMRTFFFGAHAAGSIVREAMPGPRLFFVPSQKIRSHCAIYSRTTSPCLFHSHRRR